MSERRGETGRKRGESYRKCKVRHSNRRYRVSSSVVVEHWGGRRLPFQVRSLPANAHYIKNPKKFPESRKHAGRKTKRNERNEAKRNTYTPSKGERRAASKLGSVCSCLSTVITTPEVKQQKKNETRH